MIPSLRRRRRRAALPAGGGASCFGLQDIIFWFTRRYFFGLQGVIFLVYGTLFFGLQDAAVEAGKSRRCGRRRVRRRRRQEVSCQRGASGERGLWRIAAARACLGASESARRPPRSPVPWIPAGARTPGTLPPLRLGRPARTPQRRRRRERRRLWRHLGPDAAALGFDERVAMSAESAEWKGWRMSEVRRAKGSLTIQCV